MIPQMNRRCSVLFLCTCCIIDVPFLVLTLLKHWPIADNFQEYIHRVGRTARGEGAKGSALLFLIPEELQFLRYLKVGTYVHISLYV